MPRRKLESSSKRKPRRHPKHRQEKGKELLYKLCGFPYKGFSILAKRRRYASIVLDAIIVRVYYTLLHFPIRT